MNKKKTDPPAQKKNTSSCCLFITNSFYRQAQRTGKITTALAFLSLRTNAGTTNACRYNEPMSVQFTKPGTSKEPLNIEQREQTPQLPACYTFRLSPL